MYIFYASDAYIYITTRSFLNMSKIVSDPFENIMSKNNLKNKRLHV